MSLQLIPEAQFNPKQREMYELMSDISERYAQAGWQIGNEATLWNALRNNDKPPILGAPYQAALMQLQELSDQLQGWIIWWDDENDPLLATDDWGPRFIRLDDWRVMYATEWGGDK